MTGARSLSRVGFSTGGRGRLPRSRLRVDALASTVEAPVSSDSRSCSAEAEDTIDA